ncbi:MAG: lysophospholipid acyltransferase family protein [Deltaproteobacteria bacterium]|nr:lysophospholipid acyltransferase family protein [Deltaproteobacteria bacterium]
MARKNNTVDKALYWLRYRIGEYCLRGFVFVFPWVPQRLLASFTSVAGRVTYVFLWKYRQRMEENVFNALGRDFPEAGEREELIRKAWRNFSKGFFETACSLYTSRGGILSMVAVQGEDHLKNALAKGKGVIALSAHLGSFTMIGARLASAGYAFNVVVKQPRDRRFARLLDAYRAQLGMQTISAKPRREAARRILRCLRKNEIVLLIADEFKSGGIEVEFLNRSVSAARGPVTLALRSGAAVVPMFVTRDSDDRLGLSIFPEMDLVKTGNLQEDVAANTAMTIRQLETMVRRYPDQWNWLGFRRNGALQRNTNSGVNITRPSRQVKNLDSDS